MFLQTINFKINHQYVWLSFLLLIIWIVLNIVPFILQSPSLYILHIFGGLVNFLLSLFSLLFAIKMYHEAQKQLWRGFLFLIGALFFLSLGKAIGWFSHTFLGLLSNKAYPITNDWMSYVQFKGQILALFINPKNANFFSYVQCLTAIFRWLFYSGFIASLLCLFFKKSTGFKSYLVILTSFISMLIILDFSNEFYININTLKSYKWPLQILGISLGLSQDILLTFGLAILMIFRNKAIGFLFFSIILLISSQICIERTPYIYFLS